MLCCFSPISQPRIASPPGARLAKAPASAIPSKSHHDLGQARPRPGSRLLSSADLVVSIAGAITRRKASLPSQSKKDLQAHELAVTMPPCLTCWSTGQTNPAILCTCHHSRALYHLISSSCAGARSFQEER